MQKNRHTWFDRLAEPYADFVVGRPGLVVALIIALAIVGGLGASRLTINSNQLDLISKDLPEVKAVQRVIDMVGGVGHLILALRSDDEKQLKAVADDLAGPLQADKERIRDLMYKVPVEFFQEKMVLFIKTEDLIEAKTRINKFVRDKVKRASPFFVEIRKTEPVKLELQDLIDKYNHIGKKSIADDYYISADRKMLLLLIKPMWDSNELAKTKELLAALDARLAEYSKTNPHGIKLVEDYDLMGTTGTIAYGYAGGYKTNVDDSYAIANSVDRVGIIAFLGIFIITLIFFRRLWPSLIVIVGTALGYLLTMGFTYVTVGQLNMITIVLVGILAGFGVDYGIHFTYRTRIEIGLGKTYKDALRSAIINAGRPATVASIVTGGSFLILMFSEFRGFSQFGLLAGCGTMIIGFTLFSFTPAVLALLGNRWPTLPERIVGRMEPLRPGADGSELRIPHPKLMLGVATVVILALCAVAIPWRDVPVVMGKSATLEERLTGGVRFNYNTRALMAEDEFSVKLQDEVNQRFQISSDPTALYTRTLEETKEVYDEMTQHPEKYSTVDQVVSMYSFVPDPALAAANAKVLAEWKEELSDVDQKLFPDDQQANIALFNKILEAKPYGLDSLPETYRLMFKELPTAKPENKGFLTFIYPRVDLWDGKQMLEFADQTGVVTTASGKEFRSAGAPTLFARLARIVLWDGKFALILTTLWILLMHFLDFRSTTLALASVIPLGIGLVMMLGLMALTDHRLNFMNIIILPILLGFGVSHGLYLLHRFLEGTSPVVALRSVGAAVASSTLAAIAGFASLMLAPHNGVKSLGFVACLGLATTLLVSFTVLAAVLQLLHDKRTRAAVAAPAMSDGGA